MFDGAVFAAVSLFEGAIIIEPGKNRPPEKIISLLKKKIDPTWNIEDWKFSFGNFLAPGVPYKKILKIDNWIVVNLDISNIWGDYIIDRKQ